MYYRRLTKGYNDKGKLIPEHHQPENYIDEDKDYYLSAFKYNEDQKKTFDKTESVAGINDVVTNKLWWDFDCKENPDKAKHDALKLAEKLTAFGISSDSIAFYFSGNKGFGVEVEINQLLTPREVLNICTDLADGSEYFDTSVYNASRVLRVLGTRHPVSNLYKFPFYYDQLKDVPMSEIREVAKNPPEADLIPTYEVAQLPDVLFNKRVKNETSYKPTEIVTDIDFTKKAKGWSNCKWSLLNGNFKPGLGERHNIILSIIATAKNLNYPKDTAYYMAKGACKLSLERFGGEEFPKEELWKVVEGVYGASWKGGTYSCKDGNSPWLTKICNSLGAHKCKTENEKMINFQEVDELFTDFIQFTKDIHKNTIKTGIKTLDDAVRCRTGQMIGIVGAPSSGKTSISLEILENTSRQEILSVFYSLDMASSELMQKLAQKVSGYDEDRIYKILQNDCPERTKIKQAISDCYKNVKFCFDTGVSIDNIQQSIDEFEKSKGSKVKLLLIDYNELLSSPYSDQTASSGYNAGAMKKLTNSNSLCTIVLLQPPKIIGDASDEIYSYRNIKGSSLLEQCFSIIIGVFRPGFSPKDSENDQFMVMNILKNRLGKLNSLKFSWHGLTGKIEPLAESGEQELEALIQKKKEEKLGRTQEAW